MIFLSLIKNWASSFKKLTTKNGVHIPNIQDQSVLSCAMVADFAPVAKHLKVVYSPYKMYGASRYPSSYSDLMRPSK